MKKKLLSFISLLTIGVLQAQIQTNNGVLNGVTGSNAMIDGSTYFSTQAGAQANIGKGIIIPSVNLVNFEFSLTLADGVTFPTYFDGMIVYNNATGTTLTTGNRPVTAVAVIPGYYYFSNPNGSASGHIKNGKWIPLGSTVPGDNLGNHSAAQHLALNNFGMRLKGASDATQQLIYDATADGPRLSGNTGGILGTGTSVNALTWDTTGKITLPNTTGRLQFANSLANRKIVLWEGTPANDNQYYGLGVNASTLRYQVADIANSHVFFAGSSSTASNELFRIDGNGNTTAAGEVYGGTDRWFRVRGVNSGMYWENFGGGWWMTDATWMRAYNAKGVLVNNIIRAGEGVGYIQLNPGAASNTGHLAIHRTDGTRLGYIGWDNTNISYMAENGAAHVFNGGNIIAETELYSGVNRWFRVRGNTGIYWENYGGGWNMEDTTWLRAYGGKSIYTSGVGRFDTRVETARVQGTSDIRFKTNIQKITDVTGKLSLLNGYTYTWRDKKEFPDQALGEGRDIGVIAQEVEKVFPDAVMTNEKGYKSVNYNALIPVLIEALKESNRRIKVLEDRINGYGPAEKATGIRPAANPVR